MLKEIILSIFAGVILPANIVAMGQEKTFKKNEIQIGIGVGEKPCKTENLTPYVNCNIAKQDKHFVFTEISCAYNRDLFKNLGIGIDLDVDYGCRNIYNENNEEIGSIKRTNASIKLAAKYYWINKSHFGLYSKADAGILCEAKSIKIDDIFMNRTDNEPEDQHLAQFNYELIPCAVEFGGETVRGFVEPVFNAGITINCGVTVHF